MPRGRRKRMNGEFVEMMRTTPNLREECICLMNGLCLCPTPQDSPDATLTSRESDSGPNSPEYQSDPSGDS